MWSENVYLSDTLMSLSSTKIVLCHSCLWFVEVTVCIVMTLRFYTNCGQLLFVSALEQVPIRSPCVLASLKSQT